MSALNAPTATATATAHAVLERLSSSRRQLLASREQQQSAASRCVLLPHSLAHSPHCCCTVMHAPPVACADCRQITESLPLLCCAAGESRTARCARPMSTSWDAASPARRSCSSSSRASRCTHRGSRNRSSSSSQSRHWRTSCWHSADWWSPRASLV